jgi:hypothetical protein
MPSARVDRLLRWNVCVLELALMISERSVPEFFAKRHLASVNDLLRWIPSMSMSRATGLDKSSWFSLAL